MSQLEYLWRSSEQKWRNSIQISSVTVGGVDFTIVNLDIIANKLFKDHFRWNTISGYFVELMSTHPQDELEIKPSLF